MKNIFPEIHEIFKLTSTLPRISITSAVRERTLRLVFSINGHDIRRKTLTMSRVTSECLRDTVIWYIDICLLYISTKIINAARKLGGFPRSSEISFYIQRIYTFLKKPSNKWYTSTSCCNIMHVNIQVSNTISNSKSPTRPFRRPTSVMRRTFSRRRTSGWIK